MLPVRDNLREALARIISPIDWDAKDNLSDQDYRFSGLDVNPSLTKAEGIITFIETLGVPITSKIDPKMIRRAFEKHLAARS